MGVRGRTTVGVTVIFLVAAAVAAVAIVGVLRGSLVDEVDRSNENRLSDLSSQVFDLGELVSPSFTVDNDTFGAVYDAATFAIAGSSDSFADGTVLDRSFEDFDTPFGADLSHLKETNGVSNFRAMASFVAADAGDGGGTQPGVDDDLVVAGDLVVYVGSSLDGVDRTVRSVTTVVSAAVPLLTILVGLLTWVVTGRALRPVDRMRAEVDEITIADLDRRVAQPPGGGPIVRLAATMNRMLERVSLGQQRQQQFVSDASHELRSPLASMRAQLDVDLAHPETVEWPQTAQLLRDETARMHRMIEDLLLLARSDGAAPERPSGLVDLDDVVLEAVGAGVETSQVSAGLVRGDAGQLRRVVENLVANARRHAVASVWVGLHEDDDAVVLWVDDDGAGIAGEDRAQVFERFVRLDEARSRDAGGSGLGLAICAEIVANHGGAIEVGDNPAGGARFIVKLPKA